MNPFSEVMQSDFLALAPRFPGANIPWLRDVRKQAFDRFKTTGLPTLRDEDWKYTDLSLLRQSAFSIGDTGVGDTADIKILDSLDVPRFSDHRFVFVNGRFNAGLSSVEGLPKGVSFKDLRAVLLDDSGHLQHHLSARATDDASVLVSLNSAFVSDGAVIEIEPDMDPQQPLHLIFISAASAAPVMAAPRIIVKAGPNSRCAVVESYHGNPHSALLTNAVSEIFAGPGSSVDHYHIQCEGHSTYHFAGIFVESQRDSTVASHSVALGGGLTRVDIHAELTEPGSSVSLNGLFFATGRQHVDHHTTVHHRVRETHSAENYRGILDDFGRGVFNGKVVVHPDAQHITATQSNKNLLLSSNAEMDTKPELQIHADDVKCSHGATVGQLDYNALFYLRSRGITEIDGRALLTLAFADDVVRSIQQSPVSDWLGRAIAGRIGQVELLRDFI